MKWKLCGTFHLVWWRVQWEIVKDIIRFTICSLWLMEGIDLLCTPQGRVFVHVEQMYTIQIKNLCLKFAKVQFLDHWGKIPGNATFHLRGRFNHIFESLLQLKNVNVIHWSGTELREPLQIVFSRSIIFFSRDTGVAKPSFRVRNWERIWTMHPPCVRT